MRPAGSTRRALLRVMLAGAAGSFDALADLAGVSASDAQVALANLRRDGLVCAVGTAGAQPARGRPRVVYAARVDERMGRFGLDRLISSAWR